MNSEFLENDGFFDDDFLSDIDDWAAGSPKGSSTDADQVIDPSQTLSYPTGTKLVSPTGCSRSQFSHTKELTSPSTVRRYTDSQTSSWTAAESPNKKVRLGETWGNQTSNSGSRAAPKKSAVEEENIRFLEHFQDPTVNRLLSALADPTARIKLPSELSVDQSQSKSSGNNGTSALAANGSILPMQIRIQGVGLKPHHIQRMENKQKAKDRQQDHRSSSMREGDSVHQNLAERRSTVRSEPMQRDTLATINPDSGYVSHDGNSGSAEYYKDIPAVPSNSHPYELQTDSEGDINLMSYLESIDLDFETYTLLCNGWTPGTSVAPTPMHSTYPVAPKAVAPAVAPSPRAHNLVKKLTSNPPYMSTSRTSSSTPFASSSSSSRSKLLHTVAETDTGPMSKEEVDYILSHLSSIDPSTPTAASALFSPRNKHFWGSYASTPFASTPLHRTPTPMYKSNTTIGSGGGVVSTSRKGSMSGSLLPTIEEGSHDGEDHKEAESPITHTARSQSSIQSPNSIYSHKSISSLDNEKHMKRDPTHMDARKGDKEREPDEKRSGKKKKKSKTKDGASKSTPSLLQIQFRQQLQQLTKQSSERSTPEPSNLTPCESSSQPPNGGNGNRQESHIAGSSHVVSPEARGGGKSNPSELLGLLGFQVKKRKTSAPDVRSDGSDYVGKERKHVLKSVEHDSSTLSTSALATAAGMQASRNMQTLSSHSMIKSTPDSVGMMTAENTTSHTTEGLVEPNGEKCVLHGTEASNNTDSYKIDKSYRFSGSTYVEAKASSTFKDYQSNCIDGEGKIYDYDRSDLGMQGDSLGATIKAVGIRDGKGSARPWAASGDEKEDKGERSLEGIAANVTELLRLSIPLSHSNDGMNSSTSGNNSRDNLVDQTEVQKGMIGTLAQPLGKYVPTYRIDSIARELQVHIRRVYDVVNVLQVLNLVVTETVGRIRWAGLGEIRDVLSSMQAEAIIKYPDTARTSGLLKSFETSKTDFSLDIPALMTSQKEILIEKDVDRQPSGYVYQDPRSLYVHSCETCLVSNGSALGSITTAQDDLQLVEKLSGCQELQSGSQNDFEGVTDALPEAIEPITGSTKRAAEHSTVNEGCSVTTISSVSSITSAFPSTSSSPTIINQAVSQVSVRYGPTSGSASSSSQATDLSTHSNGGGFVPIEKVMKAKSKSSDSLCAHFLMLFLTGHNDISIQDAFKLLEEGNLATKGNEKGNALCISQSEASSSIETMGISVEDQTAEATYTQRVPPVNKKVRRLNDIAIVLCTIGLLTKHVSKESTSTRRRVTALRWNGECIHYIRANYHLHGSRFSEPTISQNQSCQQTPYVSTSLLVPHARTTHSDASAPSTEKDVGSLMHDTLASPVGITSTMLSPN